MEGVGEMSGFWAGKRVFLTGHTGFKGSWLAIWLQHLGARVTGYALAPPPATPCLFEIARVGAGMHSILGDVTDYDHLASALRSAEPDIVIHLAAQPLLRYSYANPCETYRTNVMGTVHLLQAVRQISAVRVVLNITSDKCYENREWVWGYRENDRLGGRDPYSSSKACAELVASAFRASFFQPGSHAGRTVALATARAGNVIGGGDWAPDRLIPDILRAIAAGEVVEIRSPTAIRPWQHVLDPLSGYLALAEHLFTDGLAFSDAWNFGPAKADAHSVAWIADRLTGMWSPEARWTATRVPQPHEDHYLRLDSAKAGQKLGWRTRWDLSTALSHIVSWHKAWLAGDDMAARTLADIVDFTGARRDRGDSG
ncbi:CDP-glucose 4,6-dehydratase [Bradyrhizobium sp. ISRA443]|uniref:CDP-glucose 4,6-dehydratase n=1 Tax=unclassified Bradyrhizobium TaxID=2631580 RepID=UPI00247966BD|nr:MULTISPECIES: CDP-glucose 4,6-dehydratase [unclassified Bradyrhizobium]WGR97913.1 CDP-glucose 4,6-dehydratase [Bradyrhizobium sp. ISRA436]WGS04803.1 CDP-glucose 4,6-dehydratase [Bradyrhizobium sp. ISRA437]WGS11683.1 CDP-glucose 4,6-dehydratase [Bradyrhizobium sp. ISRA443]